MEAFGPIRAAPSPNLSPEGRGTRKPLPLLAEERAGVRSGGVVRCGACIQVSGKGYSLVRREPLMRAVHSTWTVPVRPEGGVQTTVLPLM